MPFARLVLTAILGPPILVLAVLCAALSALAQLGRWSLGWDVLSHGAAFYLAGGVLVIAVAGLFVGRYRILTAAAGGLAILAAGALIAPEYLRFAGSTAPADSRQTLKVVQFNAWSGRQGVPQMVAWIASQNPDVVVIDESSRLIRYALAAQGWRAVQGRSDVMLFTRQAPVRTIVPTDNETGAMHMNGVVLATAAGEATVLGVHYPWPNNPDIADETRSFVRNLRQIASPSTVLAGDFNSTPWSFERRREDRAFGLIRRDRALASWPTGHSGPWRWPAPFPLLPIDHVYAGSAWATVSVERGPRLGSDHYPIVVTLAPVTPP